METVVIVAIGVLATIFLASFIALVVVCRHRYCHPHDLLHHFDSKSVNQYEASKSVSDRVFILGLSELKVLKCTVKSRILVLLVLAHLCTAYVQFNTKRIGLVLQYSTYLLFKFIVWHLKSLFISNVERCQQTREKEIH